VLHVHVELCTPRLILAVCMRKFDACCRVTCRKGSCLLHTDIQFLAAEATAGSR